MKTDLINLGIGQGAAIALLGYCVVFLGLVFLMLVVLAMTSYFINKAKNEAAAGKAAPAPAAPAPEAAPVKDLPKAPGTAGELKLYDTDPRDAAMIMAIVADILGKPLNELRFKSIREVK